MTESKTYPEQQCNCDTRMKAVTMLIICAIFVAVIVLSIAAIFRDTVADVQDARQEPRYSTEVNALRQKWNEQLFSEPHWEIRTEEERTLVIPIDLAVAAVIEVINVAESDQ